MLADRIGTVHHFGQVVVGVHLYRESILHVEQLHQHATRLLVGIAEPSFANGAARRRVGGECAKTVTTPHAPNEAGG
jgi:hypothetical protein